MVQPDSRGIYVPEYLTRYNGERIPNPDYRSDERACYALAFVIALVVFGALAFVTWHYLHRGSFWQ